VKANPEDVPAEDLAADQLESVEYHACSSGTPTPVKVRDAILSMVRSDCIAVITKSRQPDQSIYWQGVVIQKGSIDFLIDALKLHGAPIDQ
jgi:hypothetical protein